jgi:hypothetical protein
LGIRVEVSRFRISGLGLRVQGLYWPGAQAAHATVLAGSPSYPTLPAACRVRGLGNSV